MDELIKSLDELNAKDASIAETFEKLMSALMKAPYSDFEKQVILKHLQNE